MVHELIPVVEIDVKILLQSISVNKTFLCSQWIVLPSKDSFNDVKGLTQFSATLGLFMFAVVCSVVTMIFTL